MYVPALSAVQVQGSIVLDCNCPKQSKQEQMPRRDWEKRVRRKGCSLHTL